MIRSEEGKLRGLPAVWGFSAGDFWEVLEGRKPPAEIPIVRDQLPEGLSKL
jgi:hypothetical protein